MHEDTVYQIGWKFDQLHRGPNSVRRMRVAPSPHNHAVGVRRFFSERRCVWARGEMSAACMATCERVSPKTPCE